MGLPFTRSCALALVVVACGLAAGPSFAASDPGDLTATAASDTTVELTWTWPADPVYPDQLDVYRDGVAITNVSPRATSFLDTGLTPGSSHDYQLRTFTTADGPGPLVPVTAVPVTTRHDLANPPTNVHASFAPGNIATVTWTRGASDADVTYQVAAQPNGGGSPNIRTVRYGVDDPSPGSLTMDGFASYTSYTFTVSAIEDGGPTIPGDAPASAMSFDVLAPQFNGGIVTATRGSLGTITATWSSATDAGTGVAGYSVCIDIASCTAEPVAPGGVQTADVGNGTIRNDGQIHSIAVFAVDAAGNQSAPISTSLVMPIPATPVITLSGGNGCAPLIASVKSSDSGTPAPTFHLLVDGVPSTIDQVIGGAPYQQLTLVANATFGSDTSAASDPVAARVFDPDGPDVSPQVHGKADPSTNSEALSWLPVAALGAPIIGYKVTSSSIPGLENGIFVEQSTAPSVTLPALEQSEQYSVQVTAVDGCLRESAASQTRFRLDDNVPPTAPVLNTPVAGGRDVLLSWAPSTDNVAVDDYKIYQDGVFTGLRTSATQIDVVGLPDGFTAQFTVQATDTAGNTSPQSAPRSATTKDQTAPVWPPTGLFTATVEGGTVTLKWPAATDNIGVSVYQVSRDGVAIQNLAAATYVDKNVPIGNHHYELRAYDAAGNGSTIKSVDATSVGPPRSIVASELRVVKTTGKKMVSVGGKQGTRIVLSFKLTQTFAPGVLRLHVIKSKPTGKAVTKVRISLPARTGSNAAGKRIGERLAKKGTISIPLGKLQPGPLRLVVTATAGTITLSGTGAGSKAPTIVSAS
jgi:Fibronectin type III domain